MAKLVKISFEGQLDSGYSVELVEIKEDSQEGQTFAEGISGKLPPADQIYQDYREWQQTYKELDFRGRSLPKSSDWQYEKHAFVEECQQAADRFKKNFNEWLDCREFQKLENILRTKLNDGEEIRLIIKSKDLNLWKLPWAAWDFFEDYPKAEIAFTSSFRGVEKPVAATPQQKVRILAVCGDRTSAYERSPENLKRLRAVGAEPNFLHEPTPRELRDRLWDRKWDILFFSGNSENKADIQPGQVYLNRQDILTIFHFKNTLKTAVKNGLKIAILNAFDGLGLARLMVNDFQIPLVIAMRERVPNKFVLEFFEYFLVEYACRKQPLYAAVRKARERIADNWQDNLPRVDWLPIICQHPTKQPPIWQDLYQHISAKQVVLASVACTSLAILARLAGLLQPLELGAFDAMMRMRPEEAPDKRLLVVAITEKDIQERKEYPIGDRTLVELLKKLMQHQPRAIGLDIYLDKQRDSSYAELVVYLRRNKSLVAICQAGEPNNPDKISIPAPAINLPENVGFSDIAFDRDGIVRRQMLSMTPHSETCLTPFALSTQLAFRYLNVKDIDFEKILARFQLGSAVFKPLQDYAGFYQQLDGRGQQILINYRSPQKITDRVAIAQVLANKISPDLIKDRIILIGYTAPSVGDTIPTPYGAGRARQIPGVLIQAQMVSQLLGAAVDSRPLLWFLPMWGDILWIGLWSLVGGLLVWRWREPFQLGVVGGTAIGSLYGCCFVVLLTKGGCLPLVPAAIATAVTGSAVGISTLNWRFKRWGMKSMLESE